MVSDPTELTIWGGRKAVEKQVNKYLHIVSITPPPGCAPPLKPGGIGHNPGFWDAPGSPVVKNLPSMQGTWVRSLVGERRSHMSRGNEACRLQLQNP